MSLLYLLPLRSRRLLEFLLKNVSFYRKRDVKVGISTWSQRSTKRAYSRLPNKCNSWNKLISILYNKKRCYSHYRRSKNVGVHLFDCTRYFEGKDFASLSRFCHPEQSFVLSLAEKTIFVIMWQDKFKPRIKYQYCLFRR